MHLPIRMYYIRILLRTNELPASEPSHCQVCVVVFFPTHFIFNGNIVHA